MPRPSKVLSTAVVDRIVAAIEGGNTYESACSAAPIAPSTFFAWLRLGEADELRGIDSPHAQFKQRVEGANLEAERRIVELWVSLCPTDWRSCRDFLRARFPQRWKLDDGSRPTSYLSDDERAVAIGDAMEHYLRVHDIDVPPELSTQKREFLGSSNGHR